MKVPDYARDAVIGALLFSGASVALLWTVTRGNLAREDVGSIAMDAIAGSVVGLLVGMLRSIRDELAIVRKDFDATQKDLHDTIGTLDRTISLHEIGAKVRNVIEKYESHFWFIVWLVHKYSFTQTEMIANVSPADFYEILLKALNGTKVWHGIHQGSITTLCDNLELTNPRDTLAKSDYLRQLRDPQFAHVRKQRIIILDDDKADELQDQQLIRAYWESAPDSLLSFVVFQEELRRYLLDEEYAHVSVLDDCAIYDTELLLHYNRTTLTVLFGDRNAKRASVILRMFRLVQNGEIGRPMPRPSRMSDPELTIETAH